MASFKIYPILGTKTDVSPDDPSMFINAGEGVAYIHDAGGINVDYGRRNNTCVKSEGYTAWSATAVGTPSIGQGLFEFRNTSKNNVIWFDGKFYVYDDKTTPAPSSPAILGHYLYYDNLAGGTFSYGDTIVGGTGGTSADVVYSSPSFGSFYLLYLENITGGDGGFDNNEQITCGGVTADCSSIMFTSTKSATAGGYPNPIQFGDYVIFADDATTGPIMKWKPGDTDLTPLITKDEASYYTFKYLEEYKNRIIAAASGETNGSLEIRWTDALPTWANLEFPAANQLYKPGDDGITGLSKLGTDSLYLYGEKSITRIIYSANISNIFSLEQKVDGIGCDSNNSIVNIHGYNYFFSSDLGFIKYDGGSRISPSDVISNDIKSYLQGIKTNYARFIQGVYIPYSFEIVWTVPLAGATTNTHLLYYNTLTGQWRIEDKVAYYVDVWTRVAGEYKKPVFCNTDGHTYQITGETYPSTANIDGYRIEPIMDFGDCRKFKYLDEIWFGITDGGDYSIDVSYRSGDTVKEVLAASWSALGSISLNNPTDARISISNNARLHQIKWGTDLDSEKFGVNQIIFNYTVEGNDY